MVLQRHIVRPKPICQQRRSQCMAVVHLRRDRESSVFRSGLRCCLFSDVMSSEHRGTRPGASLCSGQASGVSEAHGHAWKACPWVLRRQGSAEGRRSSRSLRKQLCPEWMTSFRSSHPSQQRQHHHRRAALPEAKARRLMGSRGRVEIEQGSSSACAHGHVVGRPGSSMDELVQEVTGRGCARGA